MYTTASVLQANKLSKGQLAAALKPYILYGLAGASKDQLVTLWLERFGVKE